MTSDYLSYSQYTCTSLVYSQTVGVYYIFSALGITAGAHRLWAHKSYKARAPLRCLLALMNTSALQVGGCTHRKSLSYKLLLNIIANMIYMVLCFRTTFSTGHVTIESTTNTQRRTLTLITPRGVSFLLTLVGCWSKSTRM